MDNNNLSIYIQNILRSTTSSKVVENNLTLQEKVLKLLNKTFETLNIKAKDNFKNSIKDYFELSIDKAEDEELFNNIISLLIVFAIVLLDDHAITIQKLRNLRDSFIYKSEPWDRLNTLAFFLQNQNEISNIQDKHISSAHEEKFVLFKLINESFKEKPIVVNKFADLLFVMSTLVK